MDTTHVLHLVQSFGQILALTPPKRGQTIKTTIYHLLVLVVLMVASTVSILYYRRPLYRGFTEIKLIVSIAMVVIMNVFNCYTILAPVFCKRKQYTELWKKLDMDGSTARRVECCVRFVLPTVIYWVVNMYVAYVWTDILGLDYYKEYFVEVVQLYFQFYYNYFLYIVVQIILSKYRNVNSVLNEQLAYVQSRTPICVDRIPISIRKVENSFYALKELNVLFNDLFGWPIILTILYSSLLILNYLDDIFKDSFGYDDAQFVGVVVSNVSVVCLTSAGIVVLILSCNSVLDETKLTLFFSYKLRQQAVSIERREIAEFIDLVVHNPPEFSAAGFFTVSKTTIFQIVGTVATFFIIIIQFNTYT